MFRFSIAVIAVLLLSLSISVNVLNDYELTEMDGATGGRHLGEKLIGVREFSGNEQIFTSEERSDFATDSRLLPLNGRNKELQYDDFSSTLALQDSVDAISERDPKSSDSLFNDFVMQAEAEIDRVTRFSSDEDLGTEGLAVSGTDLNISYRQNGWASVSDYSPINQNLWMSRSLGSSSNLSPGFNRENVGGFGSNSLRDRMNGYSPNATAGILGSVFGGSPIGSSNKINLSAGTADTSVIGNVDFVATSPPPTLVPPQSLVPPSVNRVQPVPEPATLASFSLILCGAIAEYRRRRRK